ncbi:MAG: aldo/keto reductase [Bdellovibrionaceae bacterium]|nr:aldo/keto reductase [Bdellovibrionales bacterium]MCB9085196.1 aldo/keto reductase [Pseudobdellovibrionaceae bacterium]
MRLRLFSLVLSGLVSSASLAMEYVKICRAENDCKNFSRLVMGTDHLIQGGWVHPGWPEYSDAKAFEVLDHAADLGINFFDTSPIYVGGVEYRLGKWREQRRKQHPSKDIYVLSKGGFPFDLFWSQNFPPGSHSAELRQALSLIKQGDYPAGTYASRLFGDSGQIVERVSEEMGHTLNNLNGEVTVYLMHRDDGDAVEFDPVKRKKTPVKTIMESLSDSRIRSKAWMMGWSNWVADRVDQSVQISRAQPNLIRPTINSPYFSLFEMSKRSIHALGVQVTHQEMMDPNFQKGIKIMPYSPLGGFSILDKPAPQWENAKAHAYDKFLKGDPYWKNVYHSIFTSENEARWHRVVTFTEVFNQKYGTSYTVDQMLNAYVLAHPRTDLLAIGPITNEQTDRTVRSIDLSKQLSPQDLEYLYSGSK